MSYFITKSFKTHHICNIKLAASFSQFLFCLLSPVLAPLLPNIFALKTQIKITVEATISAKEEMKTEFFEWKRFNENYNVQARDENRIFWMKRIKPKQELLVRNTRCACSRNIFNNCCNHSLLNSIAIDKFPDVDEKNTDY